MANYYNEFDPFAAAWLRKLIEAGHLPDGDVDERSIKEVEPLDLLGYDQCHFFAGIGGWAHALRLAGWADDRRIWTGSCPCQPFSTAGKGGGVDDARHLWPDFFRLIRACRPAVVMGEQVAGKAGYGWLDGVLADLAGEDYAGRGVDIPACAVDAPHIRSRLYWVAMADADRVGPAALGRDPGEVGGLPTAQRWAADDAAVSGRGDGAAVVDLADARCGGPGRWPVEPGGDHGDGAAAGRQEGPGGSAGGDEGRVLVNAPRVGWGERRSQSELRSGWAAAAGADAPGVALGDTERRGFNGPGLSAVGGQGLPGVAGANGRATFWSDHEWIACHDGKARRVPESSLSVLVDGLPVPLDGLLAGLQEIAKEGILTHGTTCGTDAAETMHLVRRDYDPEAVQWRFGMQGELCSQEILFDFLRGLAPARPAGAVSSRGEEARPAALRDLVRSLRVHYGLGRPPLRREPGERRPDEPADALREVSWLLARCAQESRAANARADARPFQLLTPTAPGRVGAWRGFGNAIVPALAAEVIGAFMETTHA